MKLIKTLALIIALSAGNLISLASTFSSYVEDYRYDFSVIDEDLESAPSWRSNEAYPPLSPRKADSAARELLTRLVKEPERWKRINITLSQIKDEEKWVYVIHFIGFHPPGVVDGPVPEMRVVVLMDGKPVVPDIVKLKRPDEE
ncbi:hypothetical protein DDZ13_08930 [Coraliomargarita sinensis]|uniref:PepSY domain-containing protein n=1 Tax=Coraliomargarita sinensis TaxID=2174842 RepID=A0A317ZIV4_9BACT|nr:hypothetical protein [Coraliomargarita sinensis]PXA04153.1 hypothetical protein DDZ13_08930 [Coraliomargarita sinensis]